MAKPSEASRRISELTRKIAAKTDELIAKVDAVDQKSGPAFANAHDVLDQQVAEVDALDAEIRQLSNIPLGN